MQHAVDAVADLQLLLERLDVDVRRPGLDRAVDEQVHEPDDGRLAREVAEVIDVFLVLADERDLRVALAAARAVASAAAVGLLERFEDVTLAREPRLDLEARRDLEAVDRVVVGGIGHRDGERAVRLRERHDLHAPEVLVREPPDRHGLGRKLLPRDDRDVQEPGEERLQVLLGDEAEVEQQALEALAALLLEPFHLAQVLGADPPLLEEQLLEALMRRLHGPTDECSRRPLHRQARNARCAERGLDKLL